MFEIDLTKFKKYDKPGPRYTSYPTAPQFNEGFTHEDYLNEIVKTNYGNNLPDFHFTFIFLTVIHFATSAVVT